MNGFEETVKDFWISRPRRPHAGRKIAGVAAAIGKRYAIDPVVVRVALVAATVFGGFGVVFYLLGWLFLPAEGDEVSGFESLIGRGRSSVSPAFAVVLGILTLMSFGWTFGGGWFGGSWFDGGGLIGFALVAISMYLLHRSRGHENRPVPVPVATKSYSTAYAGNGAFTMTGTATETKSPMQGWDPLAADPSGWDLPDAPPPPQPPQHAPRATPSPSGRRRKSKVGPVTFGLAVLVAGTGTLAFVNGNGWFTTQHIVGLTLGVVGLGLVTGSFVRGGRGLIGLAVPLAIAGMLLTTVPFENFDIRGGVGDINATPRSMSELQPLYQHSAGDINVDLTELPAGDAYSTTIINGLGDTTVTVPENADVTFDCQNSLGDMTCLGRTASGVDMPLLTGIDNGSDGVGGQKITLHVSASAGNVEVRRG